MFETELLRSFVAVAELQGFTRAAEHLHLTQSTVSAQIRRLEAQAGRPLLRRSTRSVALTEAGETLLGYARSILRLNQDARASLSESLLAGRIRIGASEDVAGSGLPEVLRRFAARHPAVRIEVEVGIATSLFQALDGGRLDLILCSRCRGDDRGWTLWREPLAWTVAGDAGPLPDPIPLAFFPDPCPYREAALAALAGARRPWRIAYVSPSVAGVRAAALAGLAATPLPLSAVGPGLRVVGPEDGLPPLPEAEFVVCTAAEAPSEPARALADTLRRSAGRLGRWDELSPA
ncbi:LysR family transcriptional regulator [Inquilinus limosus]|uniref:LysR substrate-binding domain-containing protein n=1 Tax=Inquilinus limosus TaxID=171674 RepID=UPI003F138938